MLELPLGEQIGLDLLAAELARESGPTHVLCHEALSTAAALDRLASTTEQTPASRVLWIASGQRAESAPWGLVSPGGRLALLAPGRLAGLHDRLRRKRPRSRPTLSLPGGPRFRTEMNVAIGGPTCALWAALAAAARRGTRHDLADRFEYRYRRAMAPRPGSQLGELVAAVLRRVQ